VLLSVAFVAWLASPAAAAADPGDACVSSYEGAQAAQKRGELVRSKAELRLCLGACPTALASDCRRWLTEISTQIARLNVAVRGPDGVEIGPAKLLVDGVERPVGPPLELDPGPHDLAVEAAGYLPRSLRIEVAAGTEGTQTITLSPGPISSPRPDAEARSPNLVGPLALGGVGLVVLTTAAALAIAGHAEVSAMKDECAPDCPASRVDTVANLWTAGGILAGLGGATTIGAGVWLGLVVAPAPVSAPARGQVLGLDVVGRF
jgi:hypothetical protein